MRSLRTRRRGRAEREISITVPGARRGEVRTRAAAVAGLDSVAESEALAWIDAVSGFDEHQPAD